MLMLIIISLRVSSFMNYRLKRIMDDEMFGHTQQILNEFEQQKDSKIEVMRQRVAELRAKREEEDRKIVDAKLEQSFQLVLF